MKEHGIELSGVSLKNKFTNCLSLFTTGITSIIYKKDSQYEGITVNSFAPVSLKPKIIMWCLDKTSKSKKNFLRKNVIYKIIFLSKKQKKISKKLASTNNTFNKLYLNNIVKESLGYLECKLYKTYNVGDHYLVLHKVKSFKILKGKDPLIFFKSNYF